MPTVEPQGLFRSMSMKIIRGVAGASSVNITSGRSLDSSDENGTNALVGQTYANDNDLSIGGQVNITGHMLAIVGIYAGSGCAGDSIIIPYPPMEMESIFNVT